MLEGESNPKETKGWRRQRGASETTDGYRGTLKYKSVLKGHSVTETGTHLQKTILLLSSTYPQSSPKTKRPGWSRPEPSLSLGPGSSHIPQGYTSPP